MANLVLLYKFNNIDGWNVIAISLGILAFFIASLAEDEIKSIPDLYKVFDNLFEEGIAWIALSFIAGLISVAELAHRAMHHLFYQDDDLKTCDSEFAESRGADTTAATAKSINDTQGSLSSPLHESINENENQVVR